MTDEPRIFAQHVYLAGICGTGIYRMAERLGVDPQDFLENGYPCELADKSANPLFRRVSQIARAEWEKANGQG